MKKIFKFIIFIIVLLSISISYAHSGKTDSNDGHYDYSTGEYHYHHGYPAHQHINGICPYLNNNNSKIPTYEEWKAQRKVESYDEWKEEHNIKNETTNAEKNEMNTKKIIIICFIIFITLFILVNIIKYWSVK